MKSDMPDFSLHPVAPSAPLADAISAIDRSLQDAHVTTLAFEGAERIAEALRHEQKELRGRIQRRVELACLLRRMAVWLSREAAPVRSPLA